MKLLTLIKKDLLISKRVYLFVLVGAAFLPLMVLARMPKIIGFFAFFLTVVFSQIMLNITISIEDNKYPKATALLCCAPYSRKLMVVAKYILFFAVFLYCLAVYDLLGLFVPGMEVLSLEATLLALLLMSAFYSIYTPIEIRFGPKIMQFFALGFMLVVFFLSPSLSDANLVEAIHTIAQIPVAMMNLAMGLTSLVLISLSLLVSIKVFAKKEL